MGKKLNLIGQTFGKRTVIAEGYLNSSREMLWQVRCECGKEQFCTAGQLRRCVACKGCPTTSTCNDRPKNDLTGKTFKNFYVIEWVGRGEDGMQRYRCRCNLCGNDNYTLRSSALGQTSACNSCNNPTVNKSKRKDQTTHGMSRLGSIDPIWKLWRRILNRVRREPRYVGMAVEESWLAKNDGFINFYNFIVEKHPNVYELLEQKYSIDRIDGTQGYFPWNCRLASKKDQARNRACTHKVEYRGETTSLADIYDLEKPSMHYATFTERITKKGMTWEEALNTPVQSYSKGYQPLGRPV